MNEDDSVSCWIRDLAKGDSRAELEIWERYFERLVSLARVHLGNLPRRTADEEDVALSALKSLFRGARAGRFPKLEDRDDLWRLLFLISSRKAISQKRRFFADRRPDRRTDMTETPSAVQEQLAAVWGNEPSPEFAAEWAENMRQRLDELPDDACRTIAHMRLEGYTNREIAERMQTYEVKIERKLRLIREIWSAADESD
jgi:DNA-directed RNA polymerase specialized sigma24 family protein